MDKETKGLVINELNSKIPTTDIKKVTEEWGSDTTRSMKRNMADEKSIASFNESEKGKILDAINDIIVSPDVPANEIQTPCLVTVRFEDDDENEVIAYLNQSVILDSYEVVTPASAFGKSLLSREVGETVTWESPAGSLSATIIDIN